MANYYSQFALKFEPASPEQAAFIQEAFDKASEDDTEVLVAWLAEHGIQSGNEEYFLSSVDSAVREGAIYIDSEESGDCDDVAELIAAAQRKFNDVRPFGFEVAYSCDKLRPDAFGGVAIFIHKGVLEYMSTNSWLTNKISEAQ